MAKTRGSGPAAKSAKTAKAVPEVIATKAIPKSTSSPPKMFILPKNASNEARFVKLPHPRTSVKTRYYFCPNNGIYEFTKMEGNKSAPRSVIIAPLNQSEGPLKEADDTSAEPTGSEDSIKTGYVGSAGAELYVATPIDPLFFILAVFKGEQNFRYASDLLENFDNDDDDNEGTNHFSYILGHEATQGLWERRLATVCDNLDVGDDKMYKFSQDKLMEVLISKARTMVAHGLPPSLEETFVTRALEAPVLCVKREDSGVKPEEEASKSTEEPSQPSTVESADSQASVTTGSTGVSTPMTSPDEPTGKPDESAPQELTHLQRLRTAIRYLSSTYLAANLLPSSIFDASPTFSPLASHLAELQALRKEAAASRSMSDFSRKRGFNAEDDEERAARVEKKRKNEEEEKRKKAGESRAVRDLKKVNVQGMKKMSDFFSKKPAAVKK